MKKILFVIVCFLFVFGNTCVQAQSRRTEKFYPLNWHMLSSGNKDSVYGAEIDKAYEFLKGKEKKKKVVVAIIDSGCDDLHEDLKGVLWTNKDEVAKNQIDDDGNGYADDVHGWNFLVTKDGKMVEKAMEEGARVMPEYRKRYEELAAKERTEEEESEFKRYFSELQKSELGSALTTVYMGRQIARKLEEINKELRAKFPGEEITREKFNSIMTETETDTMKILGHLVLGLSWNMSPEATWEEMYELRFGSEKSARENYEWLLGKQVDERDLIGDRINDLKDRIYGSPVLLASNSEHGTHIAGIIGAARGNDTGMEGIADNVELMIIRAIPSGDEYDKDIALAIRYAVDNGADIINMSFGKRVSPHQAWVFDAMKYAEKKGVLLVHGAGNCFADCDKKIFFPARKMGKKVLSNFICVGATDPEGQPYIISNYGKESVDVFAPGKSIYSTVPGDNYKKMSGTGMAAAVVSGVAAMIMTYYPELSAKQIREIILKSAVTRKGEIALLPQEPKLVQMRKELLFADLCVAGGIVNASEAMKLADQMVNK